MSKDSFYFSHDYNARSDEKITKLLIKHGWKGYGLFWAIVEELYNNDNQMQTNYKQIAFNLRTNETIIESIINHFDLFTKTDDFFGSSSIERRLKERDERSETARQKAFKRWRKDINSDAENDATALKNDATALKSDAGNDATASKMDAGKERKGNKGNKERTIEEIFAEKRLQEEKTKTSES